MIKLLVIGLDGATLRVIEPLCDEGKLPNLKTLIAEGVHGTLESTFPPLTAPAWTSLATGKNPGKTGVFDFFNRATQDSLQKKPTRSSDIRRAKPYWDYLSDAGVRVGIVNYPCLYPPYEIDGIMVSGVGSDPHEEICYPKEFKQALIEKCGDYRIDVLWHNKEYAKNPGLFVEDLLRLLEINNNTLDLLLNSDLEVLTFVIAAGDFAQHYMWRYIDPSHPYYRRPEADKYGPAFVRIWQRIDEIVGSAIEGLPKQANVLIVSDHGFGPRRSSFCTNSWLHQEGYLVKRRFANARWLRGIVGGLIGRVSPRLAGRATYKDRLGRILSMPAVAEIDVERSVAFSPPSGSRVGQICINRYAPLFEEGGGSVDEVKREITSKLRQTCGNLGLTVNIYSPYELYTGKYVELAADILFEIDDFECTVHFGLDRKLYRKPARDAAFSGTHKKEGVFIACGADIKQGVEIEDAKIYDIAPTILHILGQPMPTDMDGRVLEEIFRADSEPARRPVEYREAPEKDRIRQKLAELKSLRKL